jgi:hypothetical protein
VILKRRRCRFERCRDSFDFPSTLRVPSGQALLPSTLLGIGGTALRTGLHFARQASPWSLVLSDKPRPWHQEPLGLNGGGANDWWGRRPACQPPLPRTLLGVHVRSGSGKTNQGYSYGSVTKPCFTGLFSIYYTFSRYSFSSRTIRSKRSDCHTVPVRPSLRLISCEETDLTV